MCTEEGNKAGNGAGGYVLWGDAEETWVAWSGGEEAERPPCSTLRVRLDIRKNCLAVRAQTLGQVPGEGGWCPLPGSAQQAFGWCPYEHFNVWLGLKCSGSWIWWSLKVPSDWTILIQWPNHVISQFFPAIIELRSKLIWINETTAALQHFEWESLTSSDTPLFPMTTGYGKKRWELSACRSRQAAQQVAESGEGLGFANH